MEPNAAPRSDGLTDFDVHLFNEGTLVRAYDKLGAHPIGGGAARNGFRFAVWAPNAKSVSVVGDFNGWNEKAHPMKPRAESGIWEASIPGVPEGALYKYAITSRHGEYRVKKADPFAFAAEIRPETASRTFDLAGYEWRDAEWMAARKDRQPLRSPISIYEVHLGSWMRVPEEKDRSLTYRELAPRLAEYVKRNGFTHVELLPITEHPFDGSWGYQTVGYFAPTSRFGSPHDFMAFVDELHREGIGVLLDWVPAHFPTDEFALGYFDGTHLYEHDDPRKGVHLDWKTFIFNYGRNEVRSFLLSSALFWLDKYHLDGLRVDAVASMLYLDYSREPGEWIPNEHGGRENLEAVKFLQKLNEVVYEEVPDAITIAEESTSWPAVSRPTYVGGLGFGFKWDMGWMHDTLAYLAQDPIFRKFHHNKLTFRGLYAFSENFLLPLSHDEVVHGKGSLIGKMPGDLWQRFANLRLLFGLQFAQPGKKLVFMGGEFGQVREWNHDASLDWHLLEYPSHAGLAGWVRDLNAAYASKPALHRRDCDPRGFEWIDCNDVEASVLAFLRLGDEPGDRVLVVVNATPVPRYAYRAGVPRGGEWKEILNSDAKEYGGSGVGNLGAVTASDVKWHGRDHSIEIVLPPLGVVMFEPGGKRVKESETEQSALPPPERDEEDRHSED